MTGDEGDNRVKVKFFGSGNDAVRPLDAEPPQLRLAYPEPSLLYGEATPLDAKEQEFVRELWMKSKKLDAKRIAAEVKKRRADAFKSEGRTGVCRVDEQSVSGCLDKIKREFREQHGS